MQGNRTSGTDIRYAADACRRLREFREQSGYSVSEVAEHLNMPTALYALYEEIELVPHRLIPPLCRFLNFSPWFYLTGESEQSAPPSQSDS